jgi:hypothetical protein
MRLAEKLDLKGLTLTSKQLLFSCVKVPIFCFTVFFVNYDHCLLFLLLSCFVVGCSLFGLDCVDIFYV